MLRLEKVDPFHDEDVAEDLQFLDSVCFGRGNPPMSLDGEWWMVYDQQKNAVAYSGMVPALPAYKNHYYIHRQGVHPSARGHRLQLRMLRAILRRAKAKDLAGLITDTSYDNIASANNMIEAGFKLFRPAVRWSFADALYWRIKF